MQIFRSGRSWSMATTGGMITSISVGAWLCSYLVCSRVRDWSNAATCISNPNYTLILVACCCGVLGSYQLSVDLRTTSMSGPKWENTKGSYKIRPWIPDQHDLNVGVWLTAFLRSSFLISLKIWVVWIIGKCNNWWQRQGWYRNAHDPFMIHIIAPLQPSVG